MDYVFPFVDSKDPIWQAEYSKTACYNPTQTDERFRDLGFLKYVFRSIDKNLSWIDRVILIVSSESQIPSWLDTSKVRIVYHKDFIPEKYLPVFNSNTIEAFLPLIPDLDDEIIYGNDDMFFLNPCSKQDFFVNHKPVVSFHHKNRIETFFDILVKRCSKLEQSHFKKIKLPKDIYIKPLHFTSSWKKETLKKVYELDHRQIKKSITTFRDLQTNLNQYIYTDYQIFKGDVKFVKDSPNKYIHSRMHLNKILEVIHNMQYKVLCFNDVGGLIDKASINKIIEAFDSRFPCKSKYEL